MQAYGVEIMRTSSKPWYRKQNKTWYFKFGGKQVRLSRDKAEAKRKWLKLVAEGWQSKECLQECVDHCRPIPRPAKRCIREQTLDAYMRDFGKITTATRGKFASSRPSSPLPASQSGPAFGPVHAQLGGLFP